MHHLAQHNLVFLECSFLSQNGFFGATMEKKYISITIDNKGIASIILNRVEKYNAFDDVMIQQLTAAFNQLNNDNTVACILLKANGKHFCAGADFDWMQKMMNFSEEENIYDALQLSKLFQTIYQTDKPTIALAHGKTFGGGIGLLACCDIVIIEHEAEFCFSEVKYGLIPATIAPFLIHAIGARHARRYFITAENFNSHAALSIGLAHQCVDKHELEEHGLKMAEKLIPHSQPAISATKQLVRKLSPIDEHLHKETARIIAELRVSPEAQKRLKIFLKAER